MQDDFATVPVEYTLYAIDDRIYARNVAGSLIDLGALTEESDGSYSFMLDGEEAQGEGFASVAEALQGVADELTFLFLDGQFTSLPDRSNDVDVVDAEELVISLQDRIAVSAIGGPDQTPHIF